MVKSGSGGGCPSYGGTAWLVSIGDVDVRDPDHPTSGDPPPIFLPSSSPRARVHARSSPSLVRCHPRPSPGAPRPRGRCRPLGARGPGGHRSPGTTGASPHVRGKTDADAVFGMIYAQAEDDFNRVETNYLLSTGRLAEAEGESAIWQDLRMKLFIDPDSMRAKYAASPGLAQAADGRLGRRAQLLPVHPSQGEAASHHAVRAMDGAHVQRGQHRRRHRERRPWRARGVLRRQRQPPGASSGAADRRRDDRSPRARTASRSRRRIRSTAGRSSSSIHTPRSSSAPSSR